MSEAYLVTCTFRSMDVQFSSEVYLAYFYPCINKPYILMLRSILWISSILFRSLYLSNQYHGRIFILFFLWPWINVYCWVRPPWGSLLENPVKNVENVVIWLSDPIGPAFTSCITWETWNNLISAPLQSVSRWCDWDYPIKKSEANASLGGLGQTNII